MHAIYFFQKTRKEGKYVSKKKENFRHTQNVAKNLNFLLLCGGKER